MKKRRRYTITLNDYIRANRKANREAEQELLGPGFHASSRIHGSKKVYTRKQKHRGQEDVG